MSNENNKTIRLPAHVDMADNARTLSRFEFIAFFTAHATRTAEGRKIVEGLQVKKTAQGWTYGVAGHTALLGEPSDAHRLFENIRRGLLVEYVRQAEDFRSYVLG